mmetsp:Transcript_31762/g.95091  ORF Transcript_31762/g.95091 Transcript_31762/m.95091 type:complete len:81 (+) Transcript_31762:1157-1399(+)
MSPPPAKYTNGENIFGFDRTLRRSAVDCGCQAARFAVRRWVVEGGSTEGGRGRKRMIGPGSYPGRNEEEWWQRTENMKCI